MQTSRKLTRFLRKASWAALPGLLVLLVHMPVMAQQVLLGTKVNSYLGGKNLRSYQLALYDMQSGSMDIIYSGSWDENFDGVSFFPNGDLAFSGRTNISIGGETFNPPEVGRFSWSSGDAQVYLGAANDVSAVHIVDQNQVLLAFKVNSQIGGYAYQVGDVVLYNKLTDSASIMFSNEDFFTAQEGGTYEAGNIDAVAISPAGNLLISTTNTAEIGADAASATKIFQSGVYEVTAAGVVTEFFDHNLIFGSGVDIKAFSIVPDPEPDIDSDNVADWFDQCQSTPPGAQVNSDGCALFELDTDSDGVSDDIDQCPQSPAGEPVDSNGCAWSELDDDGDGVRNGLDECPGSAPGEAVNLVGCPQQPYGIPVMGIIGQLALFSSMIMVFVAQRRLRS